MDYVTRQFIFLAKKFRKELRKAQESLHRDLANLANRLKDLKVAVNAGHQAQPKSKEASLVPSIAELRTQVPIRVQTYAQRDAKERVWGKVKGTLEIFVGVAVIAYTLITWQIWQEQTDATNFVARQTRLARQSLNQSQNAFMIQQRAWVAANNVLVQSDTNTVRFQVVWKNTGATPALKANLTVGLMYRDRDYLIDSDLSETNIRRLNKNPWKFSHMFIEPNGTGSSPAYPVDAAHPGKYLFLLGVLRYSDIFGHDHATDFCSRVDGDGLTICNQHSEMN
jgi:hypothetical protein